MDVVNPLPAGWDRLMQHIRVGCAVVAIGNGRIVLGRRGKEPMYGKWVIPGGGIHPFETFAETAAREFREETGLEIRASGVIYVAEIVLPPKEHRIVIYVCAEVIGGQPKAGSDLLEIGHFNRDQVQALADNEQLTPTVKQVLQQVGWVDCGLQNQSRRRTAKSELAKMRDRFALPNQMAHMRARNLRRGRKNSSPGPDQLRFSDM
ncbi:MAG: 8-oxo-dGTP diphosphatase [Methylobacteriaceae bacterium]|nr:8-oxo-dGTP diphosphatase [Methylobacteriaceae bacterium]